MAATTLNQQAMEHAMASRPAITDPVAPRAFNFCVLRRWRGGPLPRRESAPPLHSIWEDRDCSDALDAGLPEQGPRRPQDHLRLAAARERRRGRERARELVRVLDRLAAALAEVGHHRVDRIT